MNIKNKIREWKDIFKAKPPAPGDFLKTKGFKAAFNNRFIDWIFTSRHNINVDLTTQLETLIQRSRELSINNQLFRSYLTNCEKCIVGAEGFRLQMQIKNDDGTLNKDLNDQIEWLWYQFNKAKNLDLEEKLNGVDLDTLIMRTLFVDGECFIQIVKDPKSEFGIKFQLIDSLDIDTTKIQIMTDVDNGIFNGVEVDHFYRPVRYWLRKNYTGLYGTGRLQYLPADQVIHLYRPEFIHQVRGFSPVCASLDSLKQLDDYAVAELIAAKIASCQGVFYQRTGNSMKGDFLSQNEVDDSGMFLRELSPGIASVVPEGYSIKTLTPNHPNSNYGNFAKSIGKRVAVSMGSNYNTLFGDLESVNYSSLRQGNIAENNFYKSWQRFMIENWKNTQFELFLKNYLIYNSNDNIMPSSFKNYLRCYRFIPKVDQYYDIAKEVVGTSKMLQLGLTSPIIEIEKRGGDWNEVLEDWEKWNTALKERGLSFEIKGAPQDSVQQFNEQASGNQVLKTNNQEQ